MMKFSAIKLLSNLYWSSMAALEGMPQRQLIAASERFDHLRQQHLVRNPMLRYGAKYYSQNDEDGIIEEIVRRVMGSRIGTFLELGVGNGTENNTLNLLAKGWRGAWVGGVPLALSTTGERLTFKKAWIDRGNICQLADAALEAQGITQLDLLSIDLDGNDYHFCSELLAAGLRPLIWVLEYNGRFSPETQWIMDYNAGHQWAHDDYFGASLRAFYELMAPAGYRLVACNVTGANAFFVRSELGSQFADLPDDWRSIQMSPEYTVGPEQPRNPRQC